MRKNNHQPIERTVLAADNSQISTFLECPQKWYFEYVRNLAHSARKTNALDKGTVVHSLLEAYYTFIGSGDPRNTAMKKALEAFDAAVKKDPIVEPDDYKLIRKRFVEYVIFYEQSDFRPMKKDGKPQVELGFSIPILDSSYFLFILEGRIDLVTDQDYFVDHKSQSVMHNHYKGDTQFLTYALASGKRQGVINYFGLQETFNKNTFRRMTISFSSQQLERWRNRLIEIFFQMNNCLKSNHFPTNESACPGKYSPCQFIEIHEAISPQIRESVIKNHYVVIDKWQPWSLLPKEENA